MARQDKVPGRSGPVDRMPWTDGAYPADYKRSGKRASRMHRTPRPGGRTGPVRRGKR